MPFTPDAAVIEMIRAFGPGRTSALEIRGDVFTAIYKDSRQVIADGGVQ